ncbi:MAG: hypothetical protein OEM38_05520 [Gammaproteobacteria bacterium]|nr:hypothetical protein [Gammaproteobacteria bacterium]
MSDATIRQGLGDFSSIVCFRSIVTGLEKVMGKDAARGNLIRAGRLRGIEIIKSLGLSNTDKPIAEWSTLVENAIGKNGTRLCTIAKIEENAGVYRVFLSDTICSANEEIGSERQLSFTQGAIQGALEEVTGHRLSGEQTGSILRGDDYDIADFKVR